MFPNWAVQNGGLASLKGTPYVTQGRIAVEQPSACSFLGLEMLPRMDVLIPKGDSVPTNGVRLLWLVPSMLTCHKFLTQLR